LGTQETFCIIIAGLFERDSFDLFLPEFDKPWVIHLRETCCYSTNLCTWRPNTVYKNRCVCRHHAPAAELQPIPLSWPFAQWGLDMVGKLHKSWPGGHVYMLVAVDKFTKWIEAAPVTTQDSKAAINFIKSIVFRFGVPHSIITDNGTNFTLKEFKDYCEGLRIKLKFASVAHPKKNGQVKKANGLICSRIKK
jgi:hypothetical protein